MKRRLSPGRYRVISYQRPCDGNCGLLDPPTDRCARRGADPLGRAHRGGRQGAPGPRLHDEPQGAARALPADRAHPGGAALAALARGHQLVVADRLLGPAAWLRAASDLREREPGEGHAAGGVPARHRQARPGRRRARLARPDDHGVVERRGGHDLLPRRRRRALQARPAGRDEELLGGRLLGERPLQRRGPGALLQPDRQAGPEGLAPVRARAAVVDRELPALGLLTLLARRRVQDVLQGRLARDGSRAARSRGGAVRARRHAHLDGRAHRREPVARVRHGDAAGVAQRLFRRAPAAARAQQLHRRRPARPPLGGRGWWTSTVSAPGSG